MKLPIVFSTFRKIYLKSRKKKLWMRRFLAYFIKHSETFVSVKINFTHHKMNTTIIRNVCFLLEPGSQSVSQTHTWRTNKDKSKTNLPRTSSGSRFILPENVAPAESVIDNKISSHSSLLPERVNKIETARKQTGRLSFPGIRIFRKLDPATNESVRYPFNQTE